MCGIFGFIKSETNTDQNPLRILKEGISRIKHRGPDGEGFWISSNNKIGMAHVRLSVIDVEGGDQPMISDDGRFVIIYNGELYNYLELRSEIGIEKFKNNSDTEVVLRAWEKWGEKSISKFRGMFSIAIWDNKLSKMYLVRDRMGIKPLYIYTIKNTIYFASETKAFMHLINIPKCNFKALSNYINFQYYLADKTLFKDIEQVSSACCYIIDNNLKMTNKKYWEVQYLVDYNHSEQWFIDQLKLHLDDSIFLNLRSDIDVGCYVSGGLDSSILALKAKDHKKTLKCFNGRFVEGKDYDESEYAISVCQGNNLDLNIVDIYEKDFVENFESLIYSLDYPIAGPGSFPQYVISKAVSKHLKVIIGGQGGDEIFGGYVRYLIAYFEQCIKGAIDGTLNNGKFIVTYDSIISNLQSIKPYKALLSEFWSSGLFDDYDSRYFKLINKSNSLSGIINQDIVNFDSSQDEFYEVFWKDNVKSDSYFDLMTHYDFKTSLPALLHVEDRVSMAHGVESRVPYLDHKLIEFSATIPADIKFKNGDLKRLLKVAFSSLTPKNVTQRKDKMGFPVPLNLWIQKKGIVREYVGDIMGSRKAKNRDYLSKNFVIDKLFDNESPYSRNIWALLCLEVWHRKFIDKA